MYLTQQELMGQHIALKKTFSYIMEQQKEITAFYQKQQQKKFVFMGCGSGYLLAKVGEKIFGAAPDTTANAIAGGDYLIHSEYYEEMVKDSIIVTLSRSGQTSEMVRSVKMLKEKYQVPIISICLKSDTEILTHSDLKLVMDWCFDESVCQTRSVTTMYTTLVLMGAIFTNDDQVIGQVEKAIDLNEDYKEKYLDTLKAAADIEWDHVVVLADGPVAGLAEEGALAFTEIAMVPGVWFNLLDYRHGPVVLNNEKTLTIILISQVESELQGALVKDIIAQGGTVITVSSEEVNHYDASEHICVGDISDLKAMGIPFVNVMQMLAYEKAMKIGHNPDAPEGLHSFVTL